MIIYLFWSSKHCKTSSATPLQTDYLLCSHDQNGIEDCVFDGNAPINSKSLDSIRTFWMFVQRAEHKTHCKITPVFHRAFVHGELEVLVQKTASKLACPGLSLRSCSKWMWLSTSGDDLQAIVTVPLRAIARPLQAAVLCCAVLCCAVLCCAVLCCAVLCCAVLCCAVLCCAVLCCAVLCCAALCCAALCCAVLCCAVLCRFFLLYLSNLCKPLLTTAEQRRLLDEKGSRKKKGQSKIGSSVQPGSSLRVALLDQSKAHHSRKDGNAKKKIAGAAAETADYAQLDRYNILSASKSFDIVQPHGCAAVPASLRLVFCM